MAGQLANHGASGAIEGLPPLQNQKQQPVTGLPFAHKADPVGRLGAGAGRTVTVEPLPPATPPSHDEVKKHYAAGRVTAEPLPKHDDLAPSHFARSEAAPRSHQGGQPPAQDWVDDFVNASWPYMKRAFERLAWESIPGRHQQGGQPPAQGRRPACPPVGP